MYVKTCKICGCEYESEARNTRYCSEKCKAKAAKKVAAKRKRNTVNQEKTGKEKDIVLLINRAYKMSHEIADLCIPKKCACKECNHECEGELELHHIDHNVFNMSVDNMQWLCKKAHTQVHMVEEDCDIAEELKAYAFIKEQADKRANNAAKREAE